MREKFDLYILGFANLVAWLGNFEAFLKDVLLIISIGYALDRWIHFHFQKKKQKDNDDE